MVTECLIWPGHKGSGAIDPTDRVNMHSSPRAAGGYTITREAQWRLRNLRQDDSWKARLTTMLIDQRERGIERPEVTQELIDLALNEAPLPVHERADRLLRFIAKQTKTVGEVVGIGQDVHEAYAWSESTGWEEVLYLSHYLVSSGWLKGTFPPGDARGSITVEGYSRIAEQRVNIDSSQAFVAMWLHDRMKAAYADGVAPGIRDAGYAPLRIDRKEHINKIDDEIVAEIRRSRFVVADFTPGVDGARGSVYYEAGFAHGLGLPVIFTCREGSIKELHFDTSHYSHIVWSDPPDLREKLKNRILAVIGEGPGLDPTLRLP